MTEVIEGDEPTPILVDLGSSAPIVVPFAGGGEGVPGPPGPGVAKGGTEGQVLAKASDADYDTEWVDQSSGGGTDLTTYSQVFSLPDYPTEFPPDLSGVTASDVGALPDTTAIPSAPGDIGAQPAGDYLTEEDLPAPPDLSPYATTAELDSVAGSIPTAPGDIDAATAAQGAKADTAVQPADLPTIPSQIVSSVNEMTGDVVLTGDDIEVTFQGGAHSVGTLLPALGNVVTAGVNPLTGGSTDQVLAKSSSALYDYGWVDLPDPPDLSGYATTADLSSGLAGKADTTELFSGHYDDLTNRPAIPSSPGDVGAQPAGDYVESTSIKRIITSTDPDEPLMDGDLLLVHEPVSQFFTDFSEYPTGSAPSDWTDRWVSGTAASVESISEGISDRALRLVLPSGVNRTFLSWDTMGEHKNVEMVGRYRIISGGNDPSFAHPSLCMRGSGSAGTEQGYRGFRYRYQDVARCSVQGYEGGPSDYSQSFITTDIVPGFGLSGWHWIRVRVYAGMIYAKAWREPNTEGADWQTSHVAANLTTGLLGVGGLNECTVEWSWVGVGLGGHSAPKGPM